MKRLIEKVNKLSLPATILISSIILGIFFYSSQISKQKSIEDHQKKEYIAQRKKDCYNIYSTEREFRNNDIYEYLYCEEYDICFLMTTDPNDDTQNIGKRSFDLLKKCNYNIRPTNIFIKKF